MSGIVNPDNARHQLFPQPTATAKKQPVGTVVNSLVAAFLATVCLLFAGTSVTLLSSCGGGDDDSPSPTPTPTPPVVQPGAPTITVSMGEVNVFGGAVVEQKDSSLLIGGEKVAWWTSPSSKVKTVYLTFNGKSFFFGSKLTEKGTLTLFVENQAGKTANRDITVTDDAIFGLSSLQQLLEVDKEVNLLEGITFATGLELAKIEIEQDGQRTEIADPKHFTPEFPGTCNLIFCLRKNGNVSEMKVENLTIKPLEFAAIAINDIQPKDILPIVGKINSGDRKAYEHIEHLRIAEGTRIRDMMWKYGAGKYSPEEYQQLMLRLNTGTIGEKPQGYDNFEMIGYDFHDEDSHGHDTWDILNSIIKHANFKVLEDYGNAMDELYAKQPQNSINIFGTSRSTYNPSKDSYNQNNTDYYNLNKYLNKDNFIWFCAGLDIVRQNNILKNKLIHENFNLPDEHSLYGTPISHANSKNDTNIDKHMFVTIGTNKSGNADISYSESSSDFPIGFHPDILFSGRTFPRNTLEGNIYGEDGNYPTSFTNYTNLAMTDLCFQMKADTPNGPTLMSMILDTSLTDQIHLDGQTQELHLINPAGFIMEYLMPSVPTTISKSSATALEKGYYHGVVFDIPGAEVNINGQWTTYEAKNKDLILAQNPLTLQWRLNGSLLRKYGYKQGDTVKGHLIVVDDQWNGLNITKECSVKIE